VHDYVYAGDVARANLMAMESAVTDEGINICSGVEMSQNRILEIVAQACGSNLRMEVRENPTAAKLPSTTQQVYGHSRETERACIAASP
jgi:UDP-glucose 4-epimerase